MALVPSIRFAPPSRSPLLTRRQVAKLIGVTVHCVEKWAERRKGPKFYRTSRFPQGRANYRIEDVEEFLRQQCNDRSLSMSASAVGFNAVLLHEPPV